MSCFWSSLRRMPLALCIATPFSILITYGISVGLGHVHPLLPYISDTGTKPPESCIFSILLSGGSFILCLVVYVRYLQVSEFIKCNSSLNISPMWNGISAGLGYLSCLGLDVVACFQQSNQFAVHVIGAMTCFVSATLYFLIQTIFTRILYPQRKCMLYFRAVFTGLNLAFLIGIFLPVKAAFCSLEEGKDPLYWSANDGGYAFHLISTFSEWFLVLSFCIYICSFHWDFSKIVIQPAVVKLLELESGTERKQSKSSPGEMLD